MSIRLSYADLDGDEEINPAEEILEEKNYYPFGLQHDGYNMGVRDERSVEAEQYTFLDKEFEDNFGLNVTETDFRHYDSALGRFNVMDPLAELAYDFTPYRYGFNNPVFFSDASGLFETPEQAQAYKKANKLSGSSIEFDSDINLFKIIDGDVIIYQIGKTIMKIYEIEGEIIVDQSRAGGGGSSGFNKLRNQLNTAYTNTGFRHFIEWDGWNKLNSPFKFALMGDDPTNLKAPNGGRDVQWLNVKFIMELADIFSPKIPKRLENASNLVKYIDPNKNKEGNTIDERNIKTMYIDSTILVNRYIYWQDDMFNQSPVNPHNQHKVRVYRSQIDSVKNENRKDSIRATIPATINYL